MSTNLRVLVLTELTTRGWSEWGLPDIYADGSSLTISPAPGQVVCIPGEGDTEYGSYTTTKVFPPGIADEIEKYFSGKTATKEERDEAEDAY